MERILRRSIRRKGRSGGNEEQKRERKVHVGTRNNRRRGLEANKKAEERKDCGRGRDRKQSMDIRERNNCVKTNKADKQSMEWRGYTRKLERGNYKPNF